MIIPVDDNWRLKSDSRCWHVQRRGSYSDKKKDYVWHSKKYLHSIPSALKALADMQIRLHDSESLVDAIKFINETEKKFNRLYTHIHEILEKQK